MAERPCKSVTILFEFRDSMAHGKTVTEEIDVEVADATFISTSNPRAEWQSFATVAMAEELLADAVEVVRQLHRGSGYDEDPFISGGHDSYVLSRA